MSCQNTKNAACIIFEPADGSNCASILGVTPGDSVQEVICSIATTINNLQTNNVDVKVLLNSILNNEEYFDIFEKLVQKHFAQKVNVDDLLTKMTSRMLADPENQAYKNFVSSIFTLINNNSDLKTQFCSLVSQCGGPERCQTPEWWSGTEGSVEKFGCTGRERLINFPLRGATDYEWVLDNQTAATWNSAVSFDTEYKGVFEKTKSYYKWAQGPAGSLTSQYQLFVWWPQGTHTIYFRQKGKPNCPILSYSYTSTCGCTISVQGAIIKCQ